MIHLHRAIQTKKIYTYIYLAMYLFFPFGVKWKKNCLLCVHLKKKKGTDPALSGVGFEPTLSLENQSLNLAP